MEQSSVQDSDHHAIDPDIRPQQDIPRVIHDSEATLAHRVTGVFQVALEQIDLSSVHDRVVRT